MLHIPPSSGREVIRLFCVPHAGGGLSAFRGWQEGLGPNVSTTVVRLPGRETRFHETPYPRIDQLVNDLTDAVLECIRSGERFAFFGNSLGGLVAFETVHEIRRRTGHEATHLFVSAVGAPHVPPALPSIGHLGDADLVREVSARYGGIPTQILNDQEFLAATLPTLRADIKLLESYERVMPQPLSCPITAFGGIRDRTIPLQHITRWSEQTTNSFNQVLLDEEHLYLQTARQELTARIQRVLLEHV
jgi:medium-chain acyl-[acyl-carrier-protein] hydrolase